MGRAGLLAFGADAVRLDGLLGRAVGFRSGFRRLPRDLHDELEAALRAGRLLLVELPAPIGHVPLLSEPEPEPADWPEEPREEPAALLAFADFDEPVCAECVAEALAQSFDHDAELDGPAEMDVSAAAETSSDQAGATGA